MSKSERYINIIIQFSLFLFLFVYFTQITPLVPFDADDWSFLGTMRLPFPLWGVFNPSKVLPEVLGPLVGSISSLFVYPITRNYVYSIIFTQAIVVSLFIIFFLYLFKVFLNKKLEMSFREAIGGEIFLFLSFFFIFKHINTPSYSGFWATDFDCYFHYLIPGLLSASLVLIMMTQKNFMKYWNSQSSLYKGIFLMAVYFAMFSSPQLSIILASYSMVMIVLTAIQKFRLGIKKYLLNTYLYLTITLLWLISILFDLHGRRAAGVTAQNNGGLNEKLIAIGNSLNILINDLNLKVFFLFVLIIIITLCLALIDKKDHNKSVVIVTQEFILITCLLITFVYLMVAYLKAGAGYVGRIDAMWAVLCFFLLSVSISFTYLINKFHAVKVVAPLSLVLMALISFNFDYLPVQPNIGQHNSTTIINVDNYIINQIVKADREGKDKVTVKVPLGEGKVTPKDQTSNWPHAFYMAKCLQNTLYSHGIIRTRIQITLEPDKKINKRFYENNKSQQPFTPLETK